ncbi:hypothetical protein AVEN_233246-1 [Araneus ventricosus]|uniref:Uncharacterized protein n=1 Tax=Araneus ventricosus TaxID=182803 RepID=A0A4Y2EMD1_ARAVE|nr:hypothetical protein AVEN_233246-1 [Araneus ventricosus]
MILLEELTTCTNPTGRHLKYTDMSCCRISKQELVSPVVIVMVGLWVPAPVIVRTSFGRGRAVARRWAASTPVSVLKLSYRPLSFRMLDAKAERSDQVLSGYHLHEES